MKEKAKSLETRIKEVKQIVSSASNFTSNRLKIVYSNTQYRLEEIKVANKYLDELEVFTVECLEIINKTSAKESFNTYNLKLNLLLDKIISDSLEQKTYN
ncbi:MAG: hypothetical protein U0457_13375 [Candidatus Sericytochromatia bacterium]